MKQTLLIPLTFNASPVTTATVNVSFKVSKIHIKSIAYNAGSVGTTGYVVVMASFTSHCPLGIVNQDTTYSSNTLSDIEIKFENPQPIQGIYTFELRNMKNVMAQTSNSGTGSDDCGVIIEFNSIDEIN